MLKREKKLEKEIAMERIQILISKAIEVKLKNHDLARRYIELAKKISMKYKVRIPRELRVFCKKCLYPYTSGKFRVRIRKSRIIITCLNCGSTKRYPLRKVKVKS